MHLTRRFLISIFIISRTEQDRTWTSGRTLEAEFRTATLARKINNEMELSPTNLDFLEFFSICDDCGDTKMRGERTVVVREEIGEVVNLE